MDCLSWLRTQWDRALAWPLIVLGAVLVVVGALQSRMAWTVADQLSFMLSAGLGGILALAAGATLLISAGLGDEWRRLHALPTQAPATAPAPAPSRAWPTGLGWGLFGVAAILLLAGSRGAAVAASDPEQVAFLISGGLGALLMALVGTGLVLSADLGAVAAELVRLQLAAPSDDLSTTHPNGNAATAVFALAGAVAVVSGWIRAARTAGMQTALDGLALAAAGVAVVAVALGVAGIRRRRAVGRSLALLSFETPRPSHVEPRAAVPRTANGFYTVHGLGRFHHSSCPALSSTGGERQPVAGTQTGLEPCLLCVED